MPDDLGGIAVFLSCEGSNYITGTAIPVDGGYSIKDKSIFKDKAVTIFGGGDSALDWAVELSKNSKVNLVHRRDDFRGAQATVDKVHELAKNGKINLFTKYQISSVKGEHKLESLDIKNDCKRISRHFSCSRVGQNDRRRQDY